MNFVSDFLTSIGDGLESFLPSVAKAGVDTLDTLFVTPEGSATIVAMLSVLGFVMWGGRKVISIVKRKRI